MVFMPPTNDKASKKNKSPLLETYPNLTPAHRDAETGGAIPADADVEAAKRWVEENEL